MGQRFLRSRSVLRKIIAAADLKPTDVVLEIGPGTGTLTRALAERAGQVITVEKDERLFQLLDEQLKKEGIANVHLIHGDILKIPLEKLVVHFLRSWKYYNKSTEAPRYRVVANIPYYLTSRLIRRLLEAEHPPKDILLMVQKEVAERITAKPPRMNLLALSVQAYGRPEIVAPVPASAFSPRPKVDSAIIRISEISNVFFREHRITARNFFATAKTGFHHKRKVLVNSLAKTFGDKPAAAAALRACGLRPNARPEELSPREWARLAARHG